MKSYLRQELILFRAGAGIYRECRNEDTAFGLFVERIEDEIARERSQIIEMRTMRTETRASGQNESGISSVGQ